MLRKVGAVVAGLVVLGAVVGLLQSVGSFLHPMPEGLDPVDPTDRTDFDAWVARIPPAAWVLGFASEILGAFLGALTTGLIARDRRPQLASIVVGFALAASVVNWSTFAHPVWFIVGQLLLYPVALFAVFALLPREPHETRERARQRVPSPVD